MARFGELLREYRQRCNDPEKPGRRLTQERLGELLGRELRISKGYSGAAISDWEREASKIHADDRLLLVCILKVLWQSGGISDLKAANNLLLTGNYRPLDQGEITKILPASQREGQSDELSPQQDSTIPRLDKKNVVGKNWPPGIPFEPYYFLPHREEILTGLLKHLEKDDGPNILSIEGLGGLGKTALAAELARRALRSKLVEGIVGETAKQEFFAEGKIIQLQNSVLDYEGLLDGLARQLQHWKLFAMTTNEKEVALGQIFSQNRYLVFIDNLETAENAQAIVARLSSILRSSRALVTSRAKLRYNSLHSLILQGLSLEDSVYFLRSESQRSEVSALLDVNQETLAEIHQLTGGSPLAMKLVVAQARYLDLDRVMDQLRKAKGNLFPFIFRNSWEQLTLDAQNLLLYIGKTVVDSVSLNELAQTHLAKNEEKLVSAIDQLVGYSLLNYSQSQGEVRYSIHQLTRQFIVSDLPVIWRGQGLL